MYLGSYMGYPQLQANSQSYSRENQSNMEQRILLLASEIYSGEIMISVMAENNMNLPVQKSNQHGTINGRDRSRIIEVLQVARNKTFSSQFFAKFIQQLEPLGIPSFVN